MTEFYSSPPTDDDVIFSKAFLAFQGASRYLIEILIEAPLRSTTTALWPNETNKQKRTTCNAVRTFVGLFLKKQEKNNKPQQNTKHEKKKSA